MAIVPLVEQAQIPLVSVSGGTVITSPPKKWVFASPYTDRLVVGGLFKDMKASFGKSGSLNSSPTQIAGPPS